MPNLAIVFATLWERTPMMRFTIGFDRMQTLACKHVSLRAGRSFPLATESLISPG